MSFFMKPEFWALLLIAFVFFGAKRLPEAGSAIGKTIREFQKSMREVDEPERSAPVAPPAEQARLATTSATPGAPAGSTPATRLASETGTEPTTPAQ